MDKIKLNIKGIEEGLKKTTEAMNAVLEIKPYGLDIEAIVKDIRERQDNAIAMEFTKCIGELLKKNGVVPKLMEYTRNFETDKTFETRYGVSITELDFSEHDKVFKSEILKLKEKVEDCEENFEIAARECDKLYAENQSLKQHIDELESKETKKPINGWICVVAKEINGQEYVKLDDFMRIVNDLQEQNRFEDDGK